MRILITAGGTREYIDPVRFIANASSGKMGYALARAALKAGHKVTLISASDLQPPARLGEGASRSQIGIDFVGVESADDMFKAVKKNFHRCDCLIMAAAVADYTPVKKSKVKIKKAKTNLAIKLKPTVDILKWAGKHKNESRATLHEPRIIVGFALEDEDIRRNAEKKLREKNLDMIIANTPDAIGSDRTTVHIKTRGSEWVKLPFAGKAVIARRIVALLGC